MVWICFSVFSLKLNFPISIKVYIQHLFLNLTFCIMSSFGVSLFCKLKGDETRIAILCRVYWWLRKVEMDGRQSRCRDGQILHVGIDMTSNSVQHEFSTKFSVDLAESEARLEVAWTTHLKGLQDFVEACASRPEGELRVSVCARSADNSCTVPYPV